MLRIKRLARLQLALCACAFVSAYISLVTYRVLGKIALPRLREEWERDVSSIEDISTLKNLCAALVSASFELQDHGSFLASWGLWFVLVWSSILCLAATLLLRQIQRSHDAPTVQERENIIDMALSGKLELWKAFWGFYVGLSLVSAVVINGSGVLLTKFGVLDFSKSAGLVAISMAMSVPVVIYLTSALAVWRCAPNTSHVLWRYLARITIVLWTTIPLVKSMAMLGYALGR